MALTHNGTRVDVAAALLPSDYTKPAVTTFTDHEAVYESRSFSIAKAGVENADKATTVGAIITQLNTDIETLLDADVDTTGLTVTSYAVLKSISTNANLAGVLYTDGAVSYVCLVDVYYKTA